MEHTTDINGDKSGFALSVFEQQTKDDLVNMMYGKRKIALIVLGVMLCVTYSCVYLMSRSDNGINTDFFTIMLVMGSLFCFLAWAIFRMIFMKRAMNSTLGKIFNIRSFEFEDWDESANSDIYTCELFPKLSRSMKLAYKVTMEGLEIQIICYEMGEGTSNSYNKLFQHYDVIIPSRFNNIGYVISPFFQEYVFHGSKTKSRLPLLDGLDAQYVIKANSNSISMILKLDSYSKSEMVANYVKWTKSLVDDMFVIAKIVEKMKNQN